MIVEKISMVDALNIETKELMDSYQQLLENMSKEELISEIGRLLVDKGLLLNSRDGYINELKEDNNRLNGLLADGTEVMDYWQDKYLEEKSKNDELQKQINECNRDCEEYAIENGELQYQVKTLTEDLEKTKDNRNGWRNRAWKDEKQNAELQEQVEELTKLVKLRNSQLDDLRSYDSLIKQDFEKEKEQAIKDMAKEIYGDINDSDILVLETQEYGEIEVVPTERLKEIIKSKGVEVK